MSRRYFNSPIADLERLVHDHAAEPVVLGPILEELTFRSTDRAVRLRSEVRALLEGTLRAPQRVLQEPAAKSTQDESIPSHVVRAGDLETGSSSTPATHVVLLSGLDSRASSATALDR